MNLLEVVSDHIQNVNDNVEKMIEERKKANQIEHARDRAFAYCDNVKALFDEIRYHADKLELIIEDKIWPMPKYRELLFIR
jgi:glutamine synthetase